MSEKRQRLTSKTAEWLKSKADAQVQDKGTGIDNDTAAMNNDAHAKNDPSYDDYKKGEPSAWGEDVDKSNLWKKDKRDEMNVSEMTAKDAAEAVASVKKLQEKAVKCLVASQRILPGAPESVLEAQASDLMHLPETRLDALLKRQEVLAKTIAKAASESADDAEDKKEEEKKEEVEASEDTEDKKEEEKKEEVEASEDTEEDADAKKKEIQDKMDKLSAELKEIEAKGGCKKEAEEAPAEEKKEEDKEEDEEEKKKEEDTSKEASLLDEIFSSALPTGTKKGASSLSGLVKKEASSGAGNDISGIWDAPPDVSSNFR